MLFNSSYFCSVRCALGVVVKYLRGKRPVIQEDFGMISLPGTVHDMHKIVL